jgi:hypothetical protein
MIPAFRSDGYLPEGLHVGSDADVTFDSVPAHPVADGLCFV